MNSKSDSGTSSRNEQLREVGGEGTEDFLLIFLFFFIFEFSEMEIC